ncbi:hypothetical protein ElyMa_006124800, partial [Elysia marginata]
MSQMSLSRLAYSFYVFGFCTAFLVIFYFMREHRAPVPADATLRQEFSKRFSDDSQAKASAETEGGGGVQRELRKRLKGENPQNLKLDTDHGKKKIQVSQC